MHFKDHREVTPLRFENEPRSVSRFDIEEKNLVSNVC